MSKKASVLAIAALLNNCEALQLKDLVTFKIPGDQSLVYDDEVSDAHPKIELIVSDFGKEGDGHHHHHHEKAQVQQQSQHPEKLSDEQEKKAVKRDLDALQDNMDEDDKLRSNAQQAEEKAQQENQQKVASFRQGAKPAQNFDSSVLDAWTAGIEAPHGFRSEVPKDGDVVKRVETPQEHLFDIIKKEDDKKKEAAEEARRAEAKQISIEEERKQRKAAEVAKAKTESDYEMPKDVDDDIKDLYSDTI